MVEAHRPADQARGRAASAVAQDLVAVADELALQVENSRCRNSRVAPQAVPFAVGYQREIARLLTLDLMTTFGVTARKRTGRSAMPALQPLGRSDLLVPRLGVGAMTWGEAHGLARLHPAKVAYGGAEGR